ncbi:MAG: hypothetical protein ABSE45_07890 [Candidatus Acidiferrales bacterium]|jgi:hypothetical protein
MRRTIAISLAALLAGAGGTVAAGRNSADRRVGLALPRLRDFSGTKVTPIHMCCLFLG